MTTLADIIAGHAAAHPDKTAITGPDATLTYGELADAVERAGRFLAGPCGLKKGDRIAYYGLNSAGLLVLLFAAARNGLILMPLNWRLAADEIRYALSDGGPKALFTDTSFADQATGLADAEPDCHIYPLWAWSDVAADADTPAGDRGDPLLIVHTSGTTGRPKGAVLTQNTIRANATESREMHGLTAADHVLTVIPMFHVGGLNIQTVPALLTGAQVTLHAKFDPDRVLAEIEAKRPTLTVQVPATLQAMMASPQWAETDLSSLRAIATGSTDVPVALIEAVHARGVPVIQVYGATETGPVIMYQTIADAHDRIGSIGRAGSGAEIRLVDAAGHDVADGETGEIWVRAPNIATHYWNSPEATAAAFQDRWFRSGDMARLDGDGFYWFADRMKNVVISGGENIYPAELERVLAAVPGIREAAVVGRADPRWGAVPVAVVAASDPALDAAAIRAAFTGKLARYKHPKDVVFTDALPRNAMGKVEVEAVKAMVRAAS